MSEWPLQPLSEVATVYDGPHATPTKTDIGPWYLSISSLQEGRLDLNASAHLAAEDLPRWTKRVAPEVGDTLFSYETRIGQAAHWNLDVQAALGRRMGLLRPSRDVVDPRYLTYAYLGPQFQELIRSKTVHGATVERLLIADMPSWPIAVPSLDEQRRIVSVLGGLDDLIETNRQVIELIDLQAATVFARSVARSDPVEVVTLSRLVERGDLVLSDGYRTRADQLSASGIPILRVADVLDSEISPSYKDHILESYRPRMGLKLSQAHDVAITTKGTVGRIALVPRELPEHVYSPQLCFLRATNPAALSPEWLYWWARSPEFLLQIGIVKDQTDMAPYVSLTDLRRVEMTLPTPATRRAVEGHLVALTAATETLRDEIADLMNTRHELLPLLMSGKVRVSKDLRVA